VFFTVITVSLNDFAGLKKTQASVEAQTCTDAEWLVIDGCSKDGTAEYLRALDRPKTRVIIEPDLGIYDAMNKGILNGLGDFIVFMNAGDLFANPGVLDRVKSCLQSSSDNVGILFGGAHLRLPSGRAIYRAPKNRKKYIWHGLPANHQATYYRQTIAAKILYDPAFRICGDYYLAAVFHNMNVADTLLDVPLADFQLGGTSHQNPYRLILEPYKIQRDILRISSFRRILSMIRRTLSLLAVKVLSSSRGYKLVRLLPSFVAESQELSDRT
jgi:putative colanic acid biosynthesis glycosyltransferase